jgi:hypothetical protein
MLTLATGTNYQVDLLLHHGDHAMDGLLFATGADRIGLVAN